MKLSVVSRAVSLSILFFIFIALTIGGWGWLELNRPYQISQDYQAYKTTVDNDIQVLLERYLRSSDAAFLQNAETRLEELAAMPLDWLNEVQNQQLILAIDNVKKEILAVRAAGKLSANPQTLLVHNERERKADITMFVKYLHEADTGSKADYLEILNEINSVIVSITHIRQAYIETRDSKVKTALLEENAKIIGLLKKTEALPRLGLYSEVDEDALVPEEPEELDLLVLGSLRSLTNRYTKELSNTEGLLNRINGDRKRLEEALKAFSLQIKQYGEVVHTIKEKITTKVKYSLISIFCILFSLITLSYFLQVKNIYFLNKIEEFLRNMVNGNFDQTIECGSRFEEIISVRKSGLKLEEHLKSVIERLHEQAQDILTTSKNSQSIAEQANELTAHQSKSTEKVAVSVTELSDSFQDVANNAEMASESACSADESTNLAKNKLLIATENTRQLGSDILSMEKLMTQLQRDGQNIGKVLEVIHGVAEQTNLLALNAAIEAARAGAHGRGFAVVADEVRLLAQRTANSTDEIREIINKLMSVTSNAGEVVKNYSNSAMECVNHTNEALTAIDPVVTAVQNITAMNRDIAQATKRQASMVDDIAQSTEAMKTSSALVGMNMSVVQESGDSLFQVSEALNQMIAELKESKI